MAGVLRYIPQDALGWLLCQVDAEDLNLAWFGQELILRRALIPRMEQFGSNCMEQGAADVQQEILHLVDYRGPGYVLGRLSGMPDFGMGAFGEIVEERFYLCVTGDLPVNHVMTRYSSGVLAYTRTYADNVGNLYLRTTCFNEDEPQVPLLVISGEDKRDCDYCVARNTNCECMDSVKCRTKSWYRIFRGLKHDSHNSWQVFKKLCQVASSGNFAASLRIYSRIEGKLVPVQAVQTKNQVGFLVSGSVLEDARQKLIAEKCNFPVLSLPYKEEYIPQNEGSRRENEDEMDHVSGQTESIEDLYMERVCFDKLSPARKRTKSELEVVHKPMKAKTESRCSDDGPSATSSAGIAHCNVSERNMKASKKKPVEGKANNFPCHLCDHSFPSKYKIDRHIRSVHLRERSFKCQLCSSQYYQKSDLRKHMRVRHATEKVATPEEVGGVI